MRLPTFATFFFTLAYLPNALSWGVLGHATVGQLASNYLTAQAKTYVANLLGPGVTIASRTSYADEYRSTTVGKFSAPYHFIDALDDPPTSCSVDTARDCGAGGCVVSAIANYVSSPPSLSLYIWGKTECRSWDQLEGQDYHRLMWARHKG